MKEKNSPVVSVPDWLYFLMYVVQQGENYHYWLENFMLLSLTAGTALAALFISIGVYFELGFYVLITPLVMLLIIFGGVFYLRSKNKNNIFAQKASCAGQLINEILKGELTNSDENFREMEKFLPNKREKNLLNHLYVLISPSHSHAL